jgi:glycosyltransferase involved in cell wall biosynthesis
MSFPSILLIAFIAIVGIQIFYYFAFLLNFGLKKPNTPSHESPPLSVIICAKNEAENLRVNLPLILNQDYPNFEVVLVNDSSSDETLEVMEAFDKSHKKIKLVDVKSNETFWGNKKYALTLAIKASKNDFLVFTDADCQPNSNQWLKHISSHFSNEKSIVLGYGAYAKKHLSFLNKLIRYETVMTALQYFSYANVGLPYMGVGRNMAYKKDLFFNNNGYSNHINLRSGDDDLFINEVAHKSNTAICFTSPSFTISEPKTKFSEWILQKRRHISTSKHYKLKHKLLLGLFFFSQLLFWILAPLALLFSPYWPWVLVLVILRFAIQLTSFALASKKLGEISLVFLSPLLELFLISTQLSIFIINLISKPKHWK